MSLPGNGKYVVRGETQLLITAMRRGAVRWNSTSYVDEEKDGPLKQFIELKMILNKIDDLREIDPNVFLKPFLDVIRTDETTGAVTSLALSSISKFLSYGLIDPTHPNLSVIVENVCDAVTHARFMGTDNASDGITLMRVMEVLHTLIRSPEGSALTNESVCEVMLSCFKICFEPRLNELLRKTAEQSLKDMVLLLFIRLPQFSVESISSTKYATTTLKKFQMMANKTLEENKKRKLTPTSQPKIETIKSEDTLPQSPATEPQDSNLLGVQKPTILATTPASPAGNILDMQGKITQTPTTTREEFINVPVPLQQEEGRQTPESSVPTGEGDSENDGEYVNSLGIRFTQQQSVDDISINETIQLLPYGLPCIQELFRFLISLCNPLDKQNTDTMIHLGLSLLTVAFEVSAENIGKYPNLLVLVKDELCKHLFGLMNSERVSIFAADLQLCFLIFESLRGHLKFQMENYLNKLSDIISNENPKIPYEMRELSLDNIVQLWQIPGFVAELYVNFDCDLYCRNLFEDLTKLMSKNTLSSTNAIYSIHILSLDALLTIISNIERNCQDDEDPGPLMPSRYVSHSRNNSNISEIIIDDGTNKTSIKTNSVPVLDSIENISSYISKSQKVGTLCKTKLIETKKKKQILTQGTELFNKSPDKGIQYLQENQILKTTLDAREIAVFLRENPGLDKKQIGEFISKKKNVESKILEEFVGSFDFVNLRIDEALRIYLETFRLPGEAPLIFLVMEHFSQHWHEQNNEPFANTDAAFRLAYAIIMLNMDQHNHNAKRLNVPMTPDDFLKNLRGLNGSNDFDQEMLLEVYNSIKNEEIIMPAEQTGLVRENYLWKVLLRRGDSKEGEYNHVDDSSYDKEIFSVIWGPSLAALSFMNDKSTEVGYQKTLKGFIDCAGITAYYKLNEDFDALILTLCKFTNLMGIQLDGTNELTMSVNFGLNLKAQSSLKTVFMLIHKYGDRVIMRESWKNILDVILQLFRLKLLPKSIIEVEDFCSESGKTTLALYKVIAQKSESGLFSSLYSYLSSEGQREPTFEEQELIKNAKRCIRECSIDLMFQDTKIVRPESLQELLRILLSQIKPPQSHKSIGLPYSEDIVVFWMEILVKVVIQNRDRMIQNWEMVRDDMYNLIMLSASCGYEYLLNRSVIALLKLAIYLMRNEEFCPIVLQSLKLLLRLKPKLLQHVSKQISIGIYELLKISIQNIHDESDWQIIFTILEVIGAGAIPPDWDEDSADIAGGAKSDGALSSEDDSGFPDRGYISDSEIQSKRNAQEKTPAPPAVVQRSPTGENWILVSNSPRSQSPTHSNNVLIYPCKLINHRPFALFKCWESLSFIVRNVSHITPYNFEALIRCMRIFVESCIDGGMKERERLNAGIQKSQVHSHTRRKSRSGRRKEDEKLLASSSDSDDYSDELLTQRYEELSIQLLDLMYTLYTCTAQMFRLWSNEGVDVPCSVLWSKGWCPLLQGIARFAMDRRREVRTRAISCLQQRALLVHDLQTLTGNEWSNCFKQVLFALLNELLPESSSIKYIEPILLEESRIRVATIMSKVFLHHLTPLIKLQAFNELWMEILDYIDKFMKVGSDMLYEQMLEILKNVLLVMHSVRVFHYVDGSSGYAPLWNLTWKRINDFLPNLKDELFREEPAEKNNVDMFQQQQIIEPELTMSPKKESILLQNENTNPLITQVPVPVLLPPQKDVTPQHIPKTNEFLIEFPDSTLSQYPNLSKSFAPTANASATQNENEIFVDYSQNPYNVGVVPQQLNQPTEMYQTASYFHESVDPQKIPSGSEILFGQP